MKRKIESIIIAYKRDLRKLIDSRNKASSQKIYNELSGDIRTLDYVISDLKEVLK